MTAPDPAWVEAGARAINGEEATATSGYYGASYRVDSEHAADLAAAVIAAVEPLIREQIAADIEAVTVGWVQYQRMPQNTTHVVYFHENGEVYSPEFGWLPPGSELMLDHDCPLIPRDSAAAIARGGAQ